MVLGAIPLARAVGAGAESRQVIGWAIVGGLAARHRAHALFVVPTAYTLFASRNEGRARTGGGKSGTARPTAGAYGRGVKSTDGAGMSVGAYRSKQLEPTDDGISIVR